MLMYVIKYEYYNTSRQIKILQSGNVTSKAVLEDSVKGNSDKNSN